MEFPVGTHKAKVVTSGLGRTGTGIEQIAVQFADDQGHGDTWYGFFTDNAWPVLEKALREGLGWDPKEHDFQFSELADPNLFTGRECEIVVQPDTYEGKTRNKIAFINGEGGGLAMKERMSAEEVDTFSRRMRAKLTGGAPMATKKAPATQDEHIPI